MATGRNQVDYTGIGYAAIAQKIDGVTIVSDRLAVNGAAATMIGKAVSRSTDDTVQLASDGEHIVGKLILVESDGFCTVQTEGYADFQLGASATVTKGHPIVGALGAASAKGFIRNAVAAGDEAGLLGAHRVVNSAATPTIIVHLDGG